MRRCCEVSRRQAVEEMRLSPPASKEEVSQELTKEEETFEAITKDRVKNYSYDLPSAMIRSFVSLATDFMVFEYSSCESKQRELINEMNLCQEFYVL